MSDHLRPPPSPPSTPPDEDPFNLYNGLVSPSPKKPSLFGGDPPLTASPSNRRAVSMSLITDEEEEEMELSEELHHTELDPVPTDKVENHHLEPVPPDSPSTEEDSLDRRGITMNSCLGAWKERNSPLCSSPPTTTANSPVTTTKKKEDEEKKAAVSESKHFFQFMEENAEEEDSRPTVAAPALPPIQLEEHLSEANASSSPSSPLPEEEEQGIEEEEEEESSDTEASQSVPPLPTLSELQALAEEPSCPPSRGGNHYRNDAAYFCSYCAYTVCEPCYRRVSSFTTVPPPPPAASSSPSPRQNPYSDGISPHHPLRDKGKTGRPLCHLCRRGHLHYEECLPFPWSCEGPYPPGRVSRGNQAAYDTEVLQRYHMIKSQYSKRAASVLPLQGSFHGLVAADGSVRAIDYRAPCCPEGDSFVFSIDNPRLKETLVWTGLSIDRKKTLPSVGLTTTIPLQWMSCPPTLRQLPPRRYWLTVPAGYYAEHGIHALALYHINDIFLRAEMQLSSVGGLSGRKVLPSIKPLLVVRLLHRLPLLRPVNLSSGVGDTERPSLKRPREEEEEEQDNDNVREDTDCPELAVCLDYLHSGRSVAVYGVLSKHFFLEHVSHSASLLDHRVCMVDGSLGSVLRRERDVTSGHFRSSYATSRVGLSPIARSLMNLSKELEEERRRKENRPVWSAKDLAEMASRDDDDDHNKDDKKSDSASYTAFKAAFQRSARSNSRPREHTPPPPSLTTDRKGALKEIIEIEDSNEVPVQECSPSPPLPGGKEEGDHYHSASPLPPPPHGIHPTEKKVKVSSSSSPSSAVVTAERPPIKLIPVVLPEAYQRESKILSRLNGQVLHFQEKEEEKEKVETEQKEEEEEEATLHRGERRPPPPLHSLYTVKPIVFRYDSEEVQQRLWSRLQRPSRCVQWLSLPRHTPHAADTDITTTGSSVGVRPTLLVLHNIDFIDGAAERILLRLLQQYPLQLQLLTSYDRPWWSSSSTALSIDLVPLHLRHLLRPRVYEMRYFTVFQLMTEYEAAAHGKDLHRSRRNVTGTLPMHDTVKRILYSLPATFAELVSVLVDVQEEAGEGRYVSLFTLVEKLEQRGILISQGRLKALQRELTSNRLAVYDPALHALMIPQHLKVKKILLEVEEERKTE